MAKNSTRVQHCFSLIHVKPLYALPIVDFMLRLESPLISVSPRLNLTSNYFLRKRRVSFQIYQANSTIAHNKCGSVLPLGGKYEFGANDLKANCCLLRSIIKIFLGWSNTFACILWSALAHKDDMVDAVLREKIIFPRV